MSPSPLDFSRQLNNNYWNGHFIFGWEQKKNKIMKINVKRVKKRRDWCKASLEL